MSGVMMNAKQDIAYKLGCGRLLIQPRAVDFAGEEAARLGTHALVLGGPHTLPLLQERLQHSLADAGCHAAYFVYEGPCSEEACLAYAKACTDGGHDLVIGVGGGRMMDIAKVVAEVAGVPVICIPTSSATCAAYTPLSVMYTHEGRCLGSWYLRREVSCLICDTDIIAAQPERLAAAGMLDSMAKHIEIAWHQRGNFVPPDGAAAALLASHLYTKLCNTSPGDADVAYLSIVETGLISNLTRGFYQSALGHAFYEAVRTFRPVQSAGALHGEIVALGLVLQERFARNELLAHDLLAQMKALCMPCTLHEIGMPQDKESLTTFASLRFFDSFVPAQEKNRYIQLLMEVV